MKFLLDFILPKQRTVEEFQNLSDAEICKRLKPSKHPISLFCYRDRKMKDLIYQLKFNENKWVAKLFGRLLAEKINNKEKYILIPVPIHRKRKSERGYNQCEWICEEICKQLPNLEYRPDVLKRIKHTTKQSWSNRNERRDNIRGVFEVTKNISGKKIILIDDVYTTGSTVKEAQRTLKESSVREILIYVIAS